MKRVVLAMLAIAAVSLTSCKEDATAKMDDTAIANAETRDAKAAAFPVMKFDKVEHDFGTINEGDVVEESFTFTNTGTEPLVIVDAKGSCGCTVPQWPREAIAPGATGEMVVKFNSNGKPNQQLKTVNIKANTEAGNEVIKIRAFVTPKAKPAS